jgi:DNA-directed RNA polymerase subunit RPC12/RpoP
VMLYRCPDCGLEVIPGRADNRDIGFHQRNQAASKEFVKAVGKRIWRI